MRTVRVFLAGPSDCSEQRDETVALVDRLNRGYCKALELELKIVRFEDLCSPFGKRPQSVLNEKSDECQVMLFLLGSTLGQPTKDTCHESYTEEELCRAIRRLNSTGWPYIHFFFAGIDPAVLRDPGRQLERVIAFKNRVRSTDLTLYDTFEDTAHFSVLLQRMLETTATRIAKGKGPEIGEKAKIASALKLLCCDDIGHRSEPEPSTEVPDLDLAERGRRLAAGGDLSGAIEAFSRVIGDSHDAQALGTAADFYIQRHQHEVAAKILSIVHDEALELTPEQDIDWTVRRAQVFEGQRLFEQARQAANQALKAANDRAYSSGQCAALRALGNIEATAGNVREAVKHHEECLKKAEHAKLDGDIAAACSNLGHLVSELGETDRAIQLLKRAIEVDTRRGFPLKVAMYKNNLANVLHRAGRYGEEFGLLREAYAEGKKSGDDRMVALAAGNLAGTLIERGEVQEALPFVHEAFDAAGRIGDPTLEARSYATIASLYVQTGNSALAEDVSRKALSLFEKLKEPVGVAGCYATLAVVAAQRRELRSAKALSSKALELFKAIGHLDAVGTQYRNLGVFNQQLGDFVGAEVDLRQSVVICEKLKNWGAAAEVLTMLAIVRLHLAKQDEAIKSLKEAAENFKKAGRLGEAGEAERRAEEIQQLGLGGTDEG